MNVDYPPRDHIPLPGNTLVEHPVVMPELVHLSDPATYVMVDYTRHLPMTISPDTSIDTAMARMKAAGSHLLLVTDDDDRLLGEITACDIMGDAPVRVAQSSGLSHSDITVEMIMTPQQDMKAIEWSHVRSAKVGHIVATMHHLECCHLPVVEDGRVRGLFAGDEITRHLGHEVTDAATCAHTLAEIIHALA